MKLSFSTDFLEYPWVQMKHDYDGLENLYKICEGKNETIVGDRGKLYHVKVLVSDWHDIPLVSEWGNPSLIFHPTHTHTHKECLAYIFDLTENKCWEPIGIRVYYIQELPKYIKNYIIQDNLKPTDFYK